MGAGRVAAVSDAGPAIHLLEVGCIELFSVFQTILPPEAVCKEIVRHAGVYGFQTVSKFSHVELHISDINEVDHFIIENDLNEMDSGERECLYLCKTKGIYHLLTDDLAVRNVSIRLGIQPVGSLGIIVRAYRLRLISFSEAEKYISDLDEISSLYVTRAVVELAIDKLGKISLL